MVTKRKAFVASGISSVVIATGAYVLFKTLKPEKAAILTGGVTFVIAYFGMSG